MLGRISSQLSLYFIAACVAVLPSFNANAGHLLVDATPGQWLQIPNSRLVEVLPEESFKQPVHGIVGPGAIVGAWSGGDFDSKRNRLMIFGGGHADYCGNEWLAFDLDELGWHLLSGPSDLVGYDDQSGKTPDGNPASRHTYNGLAYIASSDEFLVHGGSLCNGAGSADNRWWVGNPEDGSWEFQGGKGTWKLGYSMAYDEKTGNVFESRRGPFYTYNPDTDRWAALNTRFGDLGRSNLTAAIDAGRRNFLLLGQKRALVYSLENYERTVISSLADSKIAAANSPGLAFVKAIDRYVAWSGGNLLYFIHPETWQVSVIETKGLAPAANKHGIYGRFRYSEKYNGFVFVNDIKNNVHFLKMPGNIAAAKPETAIVLPEKNTSLVTPTPQITSVKKQDTASGVTHHPDWPIRFGHVWCPKERNGGAGFKRVTGYAALPNDPIGDGENNCYMEAVDTSNFSTNNQPVKNCSNLNLQQFPGHSCRDVVTAQDFKKLAVYKKVVGVIAEDLVVPNTFQPYVGGHQESLVVIGAYDSTTRRPVLIKDGKPGPATYFNWGTKADDATLTLLNLRFHSSGLCVQLPAYAESTTLTMMGITAKCRGRLLMAGVEKQDATHKADNRIYMKGVMARARNSHTVYMDRTYLNWVEDSIIMGPWLPGKHAAKYTGQNVVVRNSIHSNQGVHGEVIDDPEYFDPDKKHFGKGGLAPISMASCNRAVVDGVTVVNHVAWGNSNPQSIQWQFRDALGAGCDMPRMYSGPSPQQPYHGPQWFEGKFYQESPGWNASFWENPKPLNSYVVNSQIIQTSDERSKAGKLFALMSDGTYPSVRDSSFGFRRQAPEIPEGWQERQRIYVSGNCLDNGVSKPFMFRNHSPRGMSTNGKHRYDNTNRFVPLGSNSCDKKENPDASVVEKMNDYIDSLPQPLWERWTLN